MSDILLSGYISVRTAIEAKKRTVHKIILDRERYDSVIKSGFHAPEKRQYEALSKYDIPIEFVSKDEFKSLCDNTTAGGIAAWAGERRYSSLEALIEHENAFLVVLDGIEDPFNFGFTLRTLYAAGVDGVILPQHSFFSSDEIVVRSSAGASELLEIAVVDNLTEACKKIKEKGILLVSTDKSEKARDLYKSFVKRPLCVVFGGEKRGISAGITDISDLVVRLKYPRETHFSLSASSAVSIISFEIARRLAKSPDNVRNLPDNHRFRNT
ncbi:MAG: RNA methyltransferase [Eubacteriales bacterium]|nr:RNA methyltransferase [Eubacteriales bacterium]MDD4421884.1 RNA methyltransferase [Eubacteriales bacterium]